jgi:uncharacterized protein
MKTFRMWAVAAAMAFGSTAASAAPPPDNPVRLTARDVEASNEKIAMAYGALSEMWQERFAQLGGRFYTPRIVRYRGTVRSECGVLPANNAVYCPGTNTVYYDEVFVAGMAKVAGRQLGTDGDMTGIGIIAHEVGHAVAMQLGYVSRYSYQNEATADCLAGAFAQEAQRDGHLERGDLEEAFWGMAAAGDPTPRSTGNARVDQVMARRAAMHGHGTREQRMQNFRAGYERGAGACLSVLR